MELNTTRQDHVLAAVFNVSHEAPALVASAINDSCGSTYTKLPDVLKAIKPLLRVHGLLATFTSHLADRVFTVQLRLVHIDTGEIFGSELPFVIDNGSAHEMASLVTYARRYLLDAALNLELGCDDDGVLAQRAHQGQPHPRARQEPRNQTEPKSVTPPPAGSSPNENPSSSQESRSISTADTSVPMTSVIDPKVKEGVLMNNLWTRLKTIAGKTAAEEVLKNAVGTSYIKLIKPDQYATVCEAIQKHLSITTTTVTPSSPTDSQAA